MRTSLVALKPARGDKYFENSTLAGLRVTCVANRISPNRFKLRHAAPSLADFDRSVQSDSQPARRPALPYGGRFGPLAPKIRAQPSTTATKVMNPN